MISLWLRNLPISLIFGMYMMASLFVDNFLKCDDYTFGIIVGVDEYNVAMI